MVNNDSIDHDHDDISTCTSSTLSSTTVRFSGYFGCDSISIHVIDRTTRIKKSNNNNNSIDLTNISDYEINHDDNDNQTHSVFSISSSISSSSWFQSYAGILGETTGSKMDDGRSMMQQEEEDEIEEEIENTE